MWLYFSSTSRLESQQRSQPWGLPVQVQVLQVVTCDAAPIRFVLLSKQSLTNRNSVPSYSSSLGPSVVFGFETHTREEEISSPQSGDSWPESWGHWGCVCPVPTAVVEPNFRKVLRKSLCYILTPVALSQATKQAEVPSRAASLQRGRHVARATECSCEVRVMLEGQECDL